MSTSGISGELEKYLRGSSLQMSPRKRVIEEWADCFAHQDWRRMLALFTDDVERWEVGAPNRTHGKVEFEKEVLPGPDVIRLGMRVDNIIEEGNLVAAEGLAHVFKKDGSKIAVQFCDIFEFEGEKVRRITAYGAVVQDPVPLG